MNRLRLLWRILTGGDAPAIADHEKRLSRVESKVEVLEAIATLHSMTRRGQ